MRRSRKDIGRRARSGWLLALFLLVVPAPVMAGVEWTMQAGENGAADPTPSEPVAPEPGDPGPRVVEIEDEVPAHTVGVEWT